MLIINNLHKIFQENVILNGINLKINKGSIVGLAGPSGSGKSTLLRIIQGLDNIDTGQIVVKGSLGFMFQDFQLFPHMSVMQNVIYAPSLHNPKQDLSKEALKLLTKLGIDSKADYFPNKLSGGQKQRVALARSLMMNPDLLLCDEPTSGLDVATIDEVVELLKSVCKSNMTMIIASHDLDFLAKIAQRIIVLKNGCIAADINPGETKQPIELLRKYY